MTRTGDQGYATVTSAGIVAAVASLCVLVAGVGAQVAHSHRARVAADLAAVAGAEAYYRGLDACGVAAEAAVLNAAEVTACEITDGDVVVSVALNAVGGNEARSRAGPL